MRPNFSTSTKKEEMFPVTSQNNVQVVSIKYLLDGHVGTLFLFSYTAFTDVINMVLIHE